MTTAYELRRDAAKLDAMMLAFEDTYLHFVDMGNDEREKRNKGAMAFYALEDLVQKIVKDAEELCGHMEVCNAIFAVNAVQRGVAVNG